MSAPPITPNKPMWLLAVTQDPTATERGGPAPLLLIQAAAPTVHDQIANRFRACGAGTIREKKFRRLVWPRSTTAAVDIVGRNLVRMTTGQTSLYTGTATDPELPVTDLWYETAQHRRVGIALIPPGVEFDLPVDKPVLAIGDILDHLPQLADVVRAGRLLGMTGRARFDLPVSRPGGRP